MGSDKIFMFDNPAAGESAGIMSMIPALLQNKGLDPNLVAALMNGNKNQDAWGGAGCYWIWIILLFFLWGGNGFGNGFGNGANGIPAQLNNEAGRELLMNAIQGNGTAINLKDSSERRCLLLEFPSIKRGSIFPSLINFCISYI